MVLCPRCSAELPEGYIICPSCDTQVSCVQCGHMLTAGKRRCLRCGTPVLDATAPTATLNEFLLEEEYSEGTSKRRVRLVASDDAVGQLSGAFIQQVLLRPPPQGSAADSEQDIPFLPEPSESIRPQGEATIDSSPVSVRPDPFEDPWLKRRIRRDGDTLVIQISDFKGKTKEEQKRRLILTYVWAYQHVLGERVPKKDLIVDFAKSGRFFDQAFYSQLNGMFLDGLLLDSDGIELTADGEDVVEAFLPEVSQRDTSGWMPGMDVPSRRKAGRRARKVNEVTEAEDPVERWLSDDLDLGGFDPRSLADATTYRKLQFGFWILKHKLGVNVARLSVAAQYTVRQLPTIGGTAQALAKNASRSRCFEKTHSGEYCLTQIGEQDIEQLLPDELVKLVHT